MRRLAWWFADYAYAAYWQARSFIDRTDPQRFRSGVASPVVVILGIYESWQFMRPLIDALHAAGHPVHVVTLLQHNRLPVPEAASIVAAYIAEERLSDVVIVAHSKGGLIGKFAMLQGDPDARIDSMVAICTPFSGSRYARFMAMPSLRAFSPTDATTLMLTQEVAVNSRITSIFGRFDPHIPEGSVLPGAHNVRLEVAGHFRILGNDQTIESVVDSVNQGS